MKTLRIFLVLAILFLIASATAQTSASNSTQASAIRTVLDSQVAAWNHGDLEGFMQGYWKSEDLTFFSGGTETRGWQETLDRYKKSYQSGGREMGHLDFGDLRIEILGRDAAFVRGTWKLTMSDGKTPHGLFTLIFRRFPEGWRIIHDSTGSSQN